MTRSRGQSEDPLGRVEALAAELPSPEQVVAGLLEGLAAVAVEMAGVDGSCGLTTGREDQPVTVVNSDERARDDLDETQYAAGAGPCLTAYRTGEPGEVLDLEEDHRWPELRAHALAASVRSCLSLPLNAGGTTLGALNLYRTAPDAFSAGQRRQAELAAEQITGLVSVARRQGQQVEAGRRLLAAFAADVVLQRAVGVLVGQRGSSVEGALEVLRLRADREGKELAEIARDVVDAPEPRGAGS